ncbi:hypothetical protein K239x_53840 [Planctomycetes bacterium K23_9]|uniref:Uncharacterized protein n=1 Tax=Stieleria marina TaxID=1930275 RepID=A0A517P1W1_9BACT|nr:hypothetical protein K239x_53840 [Planctomycetes bacterium K23_9]
MPISLENAVDPINSQRKRSWRDQTLTAKEMVTQPSRRTTPLPITGPKRSEHFKKVLVGLGVVPVTIWVT